MKKRYALMGFVLGIIANGAENQKQQKVSFSPQECAAAELLLSAAIMQNSSLLDEYYAEIQRPLSKEWQEKIKEVSPRANPQSKETK